MTPDEKKGFDAVQMENGRLQAQCDSYEQRWKTARAALRERDARWAAALDRCRWMMDTCCDSSCERCGDLRALLEEAGRG